MASESGAVAPPTAAARDDVRGAIRGDDYVVSPLLRALESPPQTPTAIALHQLAANIMVRQVDKGRRGIVVCGPNRGAGATFLATNLAISLARGDLSVLLVDANPYGPGVEELIKPSVPARGLQDLLRSGAVTLDDVVHREVLPNLSILYAGPAGSDSAELIAGARCAEIMRECLRDFDFVVIDTPPANRSADSCRMTNVIGYAIIVARRDLTFVDDVITLTTELAKDGSQVVGTVFLDAR